LYDEKKEEHMMNMKFLGSALMVALLACSLWVTPDVLAAGTRGKITGRTVGAAALSFIVWPGIGQAVNDNPGDKVATHAIIGLFPPYRLWSGYDALFDRQGGYWHNRI
jgi:hypothetical protein